MPRVVTFLASVRFSLAIMIRTSHRMDGGEKVTKHGKMNFPFHVSLGYKRLFPSKAILNKDYFFKSWFTGTEGEFDFFCGGTLISPRLKRTLFFWKKYTGINFFLCGKRRVVLTAAHCVKNEEECEMEETLRGQRLFVFGGIYGPEVDKYKETR